jgi:hypothetical protein
MLASFIWVDEGEDLADWFRRRTRSISGGAQRRPLQPVVGRHCADRVTNLKADATADEK